MKQQGSIILAVLGVLLLSLIALGLLGHVLLHERINGARSGKAWLTETMYQHLFLYLHQFRGKIAAEDLRGYPAPETDYFNDHHFPPARFEQTTLACKFSYLEDPQDQFKKTRILGQVEARSTLGPYRWLAELQLTLLSGNIPLPMVPFFWKNSSADSENLAAAAQPIYLDPSHHISKGLGDARVDIRGYLGHCFNISRTQLNWITLRLRLGHEPLNEPPADGVYLYLPQGEVGAVFVQGTVDHIRFFTDEERQGIEIVQQGRVYRMVYEPGENFCRCWHPEVEEYFQFQQKIVVNGNVISLSQLGDAAFLPGTGLELLVAGTVVIRSNLISDRGESRKSLRTNLTLICGLGDVFNRPGKVAQIKVEAGPEATIDASLVVDGKFENKSQRLNIRGSLFTRELENRGAIHLSHRSSSSDLSAFFFLQDCCFISQFLVTSMEEATNE